MSIEEQIKEMIAQGIREALGELAIDPGDDMMSTVDAARFAHVAAGTIRRWIKKGDLREHRAGRVIRVSRADLKRMLRNGSPRNNSATPEQLAKRHHGG